VAISRSRIHPIGVLMALKTYEHGQGMRRKWTPLPRVVDALDDMFYAAFGNVEPTGKRRCIALDVSGSMSGKGHGGYGGFPDITPGLSPRVASSAMAMVSMRTGDPYEIVAFTSDRDQHYGYSHYKNVPQDYPGLSVLSFSPRQRIDDICKATEEMFPGGTDCSLPMLYAMANKREFDVFEVYTDSETFAGDIHPSQALAEYRQFSGINAKLVVVGMVSSGFSIADPNDQGMLDVVGFDTATPQIISSFASGNL
jgi:60 kDa SS-A/Ro ribonucleoprotein